MGKLLILGAGQYGFVAKEIAEAMGVYSQIDFLDDYSDIAIGKLDDVDVMEYDAAFVAIGNPVVRGKYLERLGNVETLIHPKAVVSPSAVVGDGTIIEAGAVVSSGAKIGRGTIIMANTVVGHNAVVGDCCQLKYNSTVSECGVLPDGTRVGCNVSYVAPKET